MIRPDIERPKRSSEWFNSQECADLGHVEHWECPRLPCFVAAEFDDNRAIEFIRSLRQIGHRLDPWTSVCFEVVENDDETLLDEPFQPGSIIKLSWHVHLKYLGFYFSNTKDEAIFRLLW